MKTLVIHPKDPTTEFLRHAYEGKGFTVLNNVAEIRNMQNLKAQIQAHDRIMLMGHGFDGGLFGLTENGGICILFTAGMSKWLRGKDTWMVFCHAHEFQRQNNIKGRKKVANA